MTAQAGAGRSWLLVLACSGVVTWLAVPAGEVVHTMWMPRSCHWMCMVAASTPYDLVRAAPE